MNPPLKFRARMIPFIDLQNEVETQDKQGYELKHMAATDAYLILLFQWRG